MSIKQRREDEKFIMKTKIREAAVELIEKEGYDQLSIRKIASKIQYSPTTIYIYYKDKAEIIADISNQLYSKVLSEVSHWEKANSKLLVKEKVKGCMRIFINSLCSEPELVKVVMFSGENVIYANECSEGTPDSEGIKLLEKSFDEGIKQGIFAENIKGKSWMLISALLGFVSSLIANNIYKRDDFQMLSEGFIQILLEGIIGEQRR